MNITTPKKYEAYIEEVEGTQHLLALKTKQRGNRMMMTRMSEDLLEEVSAVAHTIGMYNSEFARMSLLRSIDYHKKVEVPYLRECGQL